MVFTQIVQVQKVLTPPFFKEDRSTLKRASGTGTVLK